MFLMLLGISLYYVMCCCRIYKINVEMSSGRLESCTVIDFLRHPKEAAAIYIELEQATMEMSRSITFWEFGNIEENWAFHY